MDAMDSNAGIRWLYTPIYQFFGENDAVISILGNCMCDKYKFCLNIMSKIINFSNF